MVLSWPVRHGVWSGRKAVAVRGTQRPRGRLRAQGNWAPTFSEKMLPSSQHSVQLSSKWERKEKKMFLAFRDTRICVLSTFCWKVLENVSFEPRWGNLRKEKVVASRNRGPIKSVGMGSLREDTVLQSYRATLPFWGEEKMNSTTKVSRMKNYWWVCSRCVGFCEQCL